MHSGFTPCDGGFGGNGRIACGRRIQFFVCQPLKAEPVPRHCAFLQHFHRHEVGRSQRGIAEDLRQHVGVVGDIQLFTVLFVALVAAEHRFRGDQLGFGHARVTSNDFCDAGSATGAYAPPLDVLRITGSSRAR